VCSFIGRTVAIIAFCLSVAAFCSVLATYIRGALQAGKDGPAQQHVASPYIKKQMQYHGVNVLFEDWKGNLFFERQGQKIVLGQGREIDK